MQYYPLFLDITSYKCLVLGAGAVARRKIETLIKAHALEVIVIDPFVTEMEFLTAFQEEYACEGNITYYQKELEPKDLTDVRLAFAATNNNAVNGELVNLCKQKNIFCNVIEDVKRGDFIVPAHLDFENLLITVSTSGVSPAFTKALKEDLSFYVSRGYVPFLRLLCMLRPLIIENVSEVKRANVFRALVARDFREQIMALLELRKMAEIRRRLATILPDIVIARIDEKELFKKK